MQIKSTEPAIADTSARGGVDPEEQQVYADRAWWQRAGEVINLTLNGWTFRSEAQFTDNETGRTVMLPGSVAHRLIEISKGKPTSLAVVSNADLAKNAALIAKHASEWAASTLYLHSPAAPAHSSTIRRFADEIKIRSVGIEELARRNAEIEAHGPWDSFEHMRQCFVADLEEADSLHCRENNPWQLVADPNDHGQATCIIARLMPSWGWVIGLGTWTDIRGITGWVAHPLCDPPGVLGLAAPTKWRPLTPNIIDVIKDRVPANAIHAP